MKNIVMFAAFMALLVVVSAPAEVITSVSIQSHSTAYAGREPICIINGAGLNWGGVTKVSGPSDLVFLPRICVRDGKFVEKDSGKQFSPIGFQYIRILPNGIHYVFAPSLYDPARVERMLADLETHHFNIVRVFMGNHKLSLDTGIDPRFMDNSYDFLTCAGRHHVYVLPVVD